MAVSLSSSSSTITPLTLRPKLKSVNGLRAALPGYSINSHFRKSLTSVSLRRSAVVVVSAITGASGEQKCLLF